MKSSLLSLLPNETLEDIFKFVSYKSLCYNVRNTNYHFSQLSSKQINERYPRSLSFCIENGTHVTSCTFSNSPLSLRPVDLIKTIKVPRLLPKGHPPASISFFSITNEGRIPDNFIQFLEDIRPSIYACTLNILSYGKFNKNLNSSWISLDALFLKLPSRCLNITIDSNDAFISREFFSSPFVACCLSMNIKNAVHGFDNISLSNWLLNLTMQRRLTFEMCGTPMKDTINFIGSIDLLLGTLRDEAIKESNFAACFEITIYNINSDLSFSEYEVPGKIKFIYGGTGYKQFLKVVAGDFCNKESKERLSLKSALSNIDVSMDDVTNITFA